MNIDNSKAQSSVDQSERASRTDKRRGHRRPLIAVAVAAFLPVGLLASPMASGTKSGVQHENAVPPRALDAPSVRLPDAELWSQIVESKGMAIVGLKAPDQRRGAWKDQILVNGEQMKQAEKEVLGGSGVTLLSRPKGAPTMSVAVADLKSLGRLRRLASVDYIEPLHVKMDHASAAGCSKTNFFGGANASFQDRQRRTTADSAMGDVVPWNFDQHGIRKAWALSDGGGVRVGVIDTGVSRDQLQLRAWDGTVGGSQGEFLNGMSGGRSLGRFGTMTDLRPWDPHDDCGHGTRMAGTITAPRDGKNIVGVAWRSGLASYRTGDDVVLGYNNQDDVADAIRRIAEGAASRKVVAMAFGCYQWSPNNCSASAVADAIRRYPQLVFVAAAGSKGSWVPGTGCWSGTVYFPANMPEVIGVTGLAPDTHDISPQACSGPETDIAAVIGDVPATGVGTGTIHTFGGSSDATAITAGVAALIWSKYPAFTAQDVRNRLLKTADWIPTQYTGAGKVNAYRAVGGFTVSISGPTSVSPGESYTLTARASGDGPFTYKWSTGDTTQSITSTAGWTSSGSATSTVTVTNAQGMTERAYHTVTWDWGCDECVAP